MNYPSLSAFISMLSASMLFSGVCHALTYPVEYHVGFSPATSEVSVRIDINDASKISAIDFNLEESLCSGFASEDSLTRKQSRLVWRPKTGRATLNYRCKITHARKSSSGKISYDAMMTEDWALFRGDDIVPPVKVSAKKGWKSEARLHFHLPENWHSVDTGLNRDLEHATEKGQKNTPVFFFDNPRRNFDRPTGWMIAGKIGTRRLKLGEAGKIQRVAVSAPENSDFRRMDILVFIHFIWPEFERAFQTLPEKILVVGGDDPMWRGGLSAGNSFYMHADRPIISENGTSTLLHELVHMVTGVRGKPDHDWIAEGLAEYYSIELLHRAGGTNNDRYENTVAQLQHWSKDVKSVRGNNSRGPMTAAAVLIFKQLDTEIRSATKAEKSLDDLTRILMTKNRVDLQDLKHAFKKVAGKTSNTLESPRLQE